VTNISVFVSNSPRRLGHIVSGVLFNLLNILIQIHLLRLQPPCPLEQLPGHEQNRENANHCIREKKRRYTPHAGQKNGISANKCHDKATRERVPRQVRLKGTFIWQGVSRQALRFACLLKADECEGHDREVDQLRSSDLTSVSLLTTFREPYDQRTRLTNHCNTTAELLLTCRKLSKLSSSTMSTQYTGTPFRVHLVKIFGAFPSNASPKRLRLAQ
jgi:hypothetical protein